MNASTAFALVKTIQSNASGAAAACEQRRRILRRFDADHRRLDRVGAERRQPFDQFGGLLARPGHQHAPPEQRTRVEPPQVLAEADDAADHERRRLAPRAARRQARAAPPIVPETVSWLGQRAVVDDDRLRSSAGQPCATSASSDVRELLRAGVADDRAVEAGRLGPVDFRRRAALVLVAANAA